ncbi:hypothetical protein [Corallococcus sp. AS-1-6]|uniref:hypothetical protein n=1 Tax=Corallococcus sp. AS-1-6 TaxID=2874599 RepID=UPI001CBDFA3E|nr:hypothetical protein [Corallococcus sp. AS-1-6]MBZ4373245.1 hypothetical protein [Corallococcus sp. AS-1-6]
MTLDDIHKIAQIAFFTAAGTVSILTYISAKRGLLNTINTEYHKHTIARLKELSDELISEFIPSSSNHWIKQKPVEEAVGLINEDLHNMLARGGKTLPERLPVSTQRQNIGDFSRRIKSDPFIPMAIREKVVSFLEERLQVLHETTNKSLRKYIEGLNAGKHRDTLATNYRWIHNEILSELGSRGHGILDLERRTDEILGEIQKYFESFNPMRPMALVPKIRIDSQRTSGTSD